MKLGACLLLAPLLLLCYEVSETNSNSINRMKRHVIPKNDRGTSDEDLTKEQKKMFHHMKKNRTRRHVIPKNDRGTSDEDLTKEQKKMFHHYGKNRTRRSVILSDKMWRWPRNQVNYAFVTQDASRKSGVDIVVREFEAKTCLRFNEVSPNSNVPRILIYDKSNDGCHASLGYAAGLPQQNNKQEMNLGTNCNSLGIIRHEFQHSLGVIHQQQAKDRDSFITIQEQNIKAGLKPQFDYITQGDGSYMGAKYDFRSNMHYASNSFSKDRDRLDTMVGKNKNNHKMIDNRKNPRFSFYDLQTLNLAYGCGEKCRNSRGCHGYMDKNCKCITPEDAMFGGTALYPAWPPKADPRKPAMMDPQAINDAQSGKVSVVRVQSDIPGQGYLPNTGSRWKQLKNSFPMYFVEAYNTFLVPLSSDKVPDGMYLDDSYFDPQTVAGLSGNGIRGSGDSYGRVWMFWIAPNWKPKKLQ